MSYLVTMQATHTPLDLGAMDLLDATADRRFDKDAGEQAYHTGRMEQTVRLIMRHEILQTPSKMISPGSVLVAHVFRLLGILFLALKEAF